MVTIVIHVITSKEYMEAMQCMKYIELTIRKLVSIPIAFNTNPGNARYIG